ncbi:MAG: hypothetical protein COT28_13940 [Methylobacterium sp. CG08_land_8_20_14_0_20_71_15]|nr:hypothetical protein [Methylobacterium sp.]PIU05923.1 MAG: hypothetical protein COT56_12655 [Methylobacterium sp. CG09_land_8_20_14_0_10_71_15]PIU12709.1 MAG: hypothetical protein COT28_13940 [Methylobacterium sp. CG08_land_8_20_14_0_20_71_15]
MSTLIAADFCLFLHQEHRMAPSIKHQPDRPIWPSVGAREPARIREKQSVTDRQGETTKPSTTAQAEGFGSFSG